MGFYSDRVLPHLISLAMRQGDLTAYRRRVVSAARGRVLEIGIGSGLNLPFYDQGVTEVIGLDPSERLLAMTRAAARQAHAPVRLLSGSAEGISLEDASVDDVVITWTLCSVGETARTLAEIRRVLKPTGNLFFVEHGKAPDVAVRAWQDRLTPVWKHVAGGCHLNRDVPHLIAAAGFDLHDLHTGYMSGPRLFTFMFEGRARPR
jgi:ubiquinone/menaquinone biosynthesis C-methylase UbiE